MRLASRCRAAVVVAALVLGARSAQALGNDLLLYQLGDPGDGQSSGPDSPITRDALAQERFARFVGDFAMALAPLPSGLASSLGDGGFEATFSSEFALVNAKETFSDGLQHDVWPTTKPIGGALFLPTLHLRKGLPFGFEVGTDFTYVSSSTMVAATGTAKWALLEGFLYVPELSVKGFATTVLGTNELNIFIGGWDVGLSERIPLAGGAELGVYGGYQRVGISASTANIDFDPRHENPSDPTSDDTVFRELKLGSLLNPTTGFQRIYFGAEVRTALLVLGLDGGYSSGNYYSYTPSGAAPDDDAKVSISQLKLSARIGVRF